MSKGYERDDFSVAKEQLGFFGQAVEGPQMVAVISLAKQVYAERIGRAQAEYKAKEDGKLVCLWLAEQLEMDVSEDRGLAAMLILKNKFTNSDLECIANIWYMLSITVKDALEVDAHQ